MTLKDAKPNKDYIIICLNSEDDELKSYLFSLGLYEGEELYLLSHTRANSTIKIKNLRYNIDKNLAGLIEIEAI